jgi:hypothetical protein
MGKEFGNQNNFSPTVSDKLRWFSKYSNFKPSYLSQDKLTGLILECLKQDNVQLNTKVTGVKENESDHVVL